MKKIFMICMIFMLLLLTTVSLSGCTSTRVSPVLIKFCENPIWENSTSFAQGYCPQADGTAKKFLCDDKKCYYVSDSE